MNKKRVHGLVQAICLLLAFTLLSLCSYASDFPTPTSNKYVHDYVGLLDKETASSIISLGYELESLTGAQSVVVILPSTQGIPIEDYANKLFRTWGIGQKDKDNGLLLLIAFEDKSWRVEVGRGLEGALPDALTSRIMTDIAKPYFGANDYGTGIASSYSAMSDVIAKEYGVTLTKSLNIQVPTAPTKHSSPVYMYLILGLLLVDILLNRGRITGSFLQLLFISNLFGGNNRYGGRGGGGGGFGGFGGGSSNGGGSSGNW